MSYGKLSAERRLAAPGSALCVGVDVSSSEAGAMTTPVGRGHYSALRILFLLCVHVGAGSVGSPGSAGPLV